MTSRTFVTLILLTLSLSTWAQPERVAEVNAMTNQQVWDKLLSINAAGETAFGKCKVLNATTCASCACDYYFRANKVGSLGMYGWPKNPSSGDSTGCISTTQYGGYTPAMATSDFKANSKAMLIDALNNSVCGNPVPPVISGGLKFRDTSKFFFVNPTERCSGQNEGEIWCGTTGLGSELNGLSQFTVFKGKAARICKTAFYMSQKMKNSQAKLISCNDLNKSTLTNDEIQQAANMQAHLNAAYTMLELPPLNAFLGYTDAQYDAMTTLEVALFYVAAEQNSNILPARLKLRVVPAKFDVARAAGENHIIRSEIDAAIAQVTVLKQSEVQAKNLTIEQVMQQMKGGSLLSSNSPSNNN